MRWVAFFEDTSEMMAVRAERETVHFDCLARLRAAAVRLEKDGGLEKIRRRYLAPERP